MKLNLGGGSLKISGFLNLDLCEGADVKFDLYNTLPYPDGSVEEIVAIHVIESFYKWEFPAILKDWRRALMPGGKLIIEFTELTAAINLYLKGNIYGMWGIYGNQDKAIPHCVTHHYVYEKEELKNLLLVCGFKNLNFTKEHVSHVPERDWRVICS
jgi:predicted SAM-dependent methyltransferase